MTGLESKLTGEQQHLEGKWFVWYYEADYTVENGGRGLTAFTVERGKLVEQWEPLDGMACIRYRNDESLLRLLRRRGVTEVYTTDGARGEFLDMTLDHDEGEHDWVRYEPVSAYGEPSFFRDAGIQIFYYDAHDKKIIPLSDDGFGGRT